MEAALHTYSDNAYILNPNYASRHAQQWTHSEMEIAH